MSNDRDPNLQALFAAAEEDLSGAAFSAGVLAEVDRSRRSPVRLYILFVIAAMIFGWLAQEPMRNAATALTSVLMRPLVEVNEGWLYVALAPLNSFGTAILLSMIIFWAMSRRLFG